jgi:GAF domain-containing protein
MKTGRRTQSARSAKPASRKRRVGVQWSESTEFQVPIPKDEPKRLANLRSYAILDTPSEPSFDHVTQLAAMICDAPIALLSLVDSDRQWFKAKVGVTMSETSRDVAFCAHAILERDLFVVPDAALDKRFARNPLVNSHPKIRFYAGAPLVSPEDHALGTLCVIDRKPRVLCKEQLEALRLLSRIAMAELELRRQVLTLKQSLRERRRRQRTIRLPVSATSASDSAGG